VTAAIILAVVALTDGFVTIRIDTSAGQRDERTIRVPVRER
jgi:hypothetical protein